MAITLSNPSPGVAKLSVDGVDRLTIQNGTDTTTIVGNLVFDGNLSAVDFGTIGNTSLGNSAGDVLSIVGTTNALGNFNVDGNTVLDGNLEYTGTLTGDNGIINIGSGQIYKDASGNVGIGTIIPIRKFMVTTGAAAGVALFESTAGTTIAIGLRNTGSSALFPQILANNDDFAVQTNGAERLRIDSAGNAGLGVVPLSDVFNANFQIKRAILSGGVNDRAMLSYNYYRPSGVDRYIDSDFASSYIQSAGSHRWLTAPSGTAGAPIAFGDPKMTLTQGGNLLVGTTVDEGYKLQIRNGFQRISADTAGLGRTQFLELFSRANPLIGDGPSLNFRLTGNQGGDAVKGFVACLLDGSGASVDLGGALTFGTSNGGVTVPAIERARITSDGNMLVGTVVNRVTNRVHVAVGPVTSIASVPNTQLANNASVDIIVFDASNGSSMAVQLMVINVNIANANVRTSTLFSVFDRNASNTVIASVSTANGATGGAAFTVTVPSQGVIRITNTSGVTTSVSATATITTGF